MAKINEIWIISESGIPLFNKSVEKDVDVLVFGGFLSAIQSFIKSSFKEERLDKLIMGDTKISFSFLKDYQIFIVLRCHKKVKDGEIVKTLQKIGHLFIETYGTRLNGSYSDVSEFTGFHAVLEKKLDKSLLEKRMENWFKEL